MSSDRILAEPAPRALSALLHTPPLAEQRMCGAHGAYLAQCHFGACWSRCPACVAADRVEERRRAARAAQSRMAADWQRRLGHAGIPLRFQDRTLDRFVVSHVAQERALGFARAYVAQFDQVLATGRSALFVGKPGTGKTHLAAGMGLALMARHRSVLFLTVLRALRLVKDTWSRGSEWSESDAVARLARPDLLILDEVGMQFGSRTEENILFDVLNERYESRRPTLLISNLSVDEVREVVGERIWDRLREDGGDVVTFDWASYRGSHE